MKRERQQKIREIIARQRISTQGELAAALRKHGITATQSSVSRDIVEMGLIKVGGFYTEPIAPAVTVPSVQLDTAGPNLIVVKTAVGQAQPTALGIDQAGIAEVVGTVAGDDTILVAVKDLSAQRAAMRKIRQLFAPPMTPPPAPRRPARAARAV